MTLVRLRFGNLLLVDAPLKPNLDPCCFLHFQEGEYNFHLVNKNTS